MKRLLFRGILLMTDSPEVNAIDRAIPLLLNFVNSENYKILKIHEKKEFDKILNFMAEQIKRDKQGKTVDPQKFHQDLTKKLNHFNRVVEYDLELQLANSGLIKQRKIAPKLQAEEKLRKLKVRESVVSIVQNLPKPEYAAPKRVSRPRRIIDTLVRRATGKSPHLRDKPPLIFRSKPHSSHKQLQDEFAKYAKKLVDFGNNEYGLASTVFKGDAKSIIGERSQNGQESLASNPNAGVGDFIHRAHDYPLSRDQVVIDKVSHYEGNHENETDNKILCLCRAITGVNTLRSLIDRIDKQLNEKKLDPELTTYLFLNITQVKEKQKMLQAELNKIDDPEIKKIANEVIKLADKITDNLPREIKHSVKAQQKQQEKEEQLMAAPRKKPSPSSPK